MTILPSASQCQTSSKDSRQPTTGGKKLEKDVTKLHYGTFILLRILICTSSGAITIEELSEEACMDSLNGRLLDPHCRTCLTKAQHSTGLRQRIRSHIEGHTVFCSELDRDDSHTLKQSIQRELEDVAMEVKAKQHLMQRISKYIECKLRKPHSRAVS